jgi:threonine dehydratase
MCPVTLNPVTLDLCKTAYKNIKSVLSPTPLTKSLKYSDMLGFPVYLKWENKHHTGSFKERGVVNFLTSHLEAAKKQGICAASAGNHALALSFHCKRLQIPCTLIMPRFAPLIKVQQSKQFGANIVQTGDSVYESLQFAQQLCTEKGFLFTPPFDNASIIAGQSTCMFEIYEQAPMVDCIIVPVGGGGLLGGISLVAKNLNPNIFTIGVQSEWAIKSNTVDKQKTKTITATSIADGIAVKKIGAITGPILEKNVDLMLTAGESEIAYALTEFLNLEKAVIEGAAAAALVGLHNKIPKKVNAAVVVVSGSNIDLNLLSRLIERDMGMKNRLLRIFLSIPDIPGSLHITSGIIAETGANVLQVHHDRSFSQIPGNVDVTFVLEVRDNEHKQSITTALKSRGFTLYELEETLLP